MFQSAGRIFGVWNWKCVSCIQRGKKDVSIRRADFWRLEPRVSFYSDLLQENVSIRRADFWRLEPMFLVFAEFYAEVSIRRADFWRLELRPMTIFVG